MLSSGYLLFLQFCQEGDGFACQSGSWQFEKAALCLKILCLWPRLWGVTRPVWARPEHSPQGLSKSHTGDSDWNTPWMSRGSIPPPLGTLLHVAGLKSSVFKNSGYWENNSSSWNLTQLGGTSLQTAPEWKERRDNYQNHVKLNYLPAPLNEGCVPSSSLLFSQGEKGEVCEKGNKH